MKILMISSDPKLLDKNSAVRKRILEYGELFEELHVFLIAKAGRYEIREIGKKVKLTIFPSVFKFPAMLNAIVESRGYKKKYNYVTTQDPFELGFAGWVISKIIGSKLQLQIHTDISSNYFIFQNPINFLRYILCRFLLGRADSIRVVSKRVRDNVLKRRPRARVFVLPIFVDIEKLESTKTNFSVKEKYPQFEKVVLMASRLTVEKDYTLALDAFRIIADKYPKMGLIIVGEGPKRKYIEKGAKLLGIADRVKLEGFSKDVFSYMKTSDVYLLSSRYEGYSMTLLEAVAARIPIVTTNVGLVGEYLFGDKSALVCKPRDAKCLAEKLIALLENKELAYNLYMEAARSVSAKATNKYNYLEKFKETFEV